MSYADRVRETSTTLGTGTLMLDGPVIGFRSFAAAVGNGAQTFYAIKNRASSAEWEIGIGTVTDAVSDTLSRDKVIASSNAGNKTNFSSGVKDVILTLPADLVAGMATIHKDVRVATTASGTLATAFANGQNVDDVVIATGDRILIKNQSSAIENGLYVVQASGAPLRAFDLFTGFAAHGAFVFAQRGTANAGKCFRCTTTPGSDVIGTNTLTWTEFGAGATDHGALTGLSDDDHPQYALVTGTRPFTGPVGGVTPIAASDLATRGYVDSVASSLKWKSAVRVATTATGTLAADYENGDTIDGVTLATGDRILVKDQSTASQNGIYVVAASGTPTRASDLAAAASAAGAVCYVTSGTANTGKAFVCNSAAGSDVVGTNNLSWVQFNGSGGVTDHGALSGLGDDDHAQYLLTDGTRTPAGDLTIGAHSLLVTQQGSTPAAPASSKWKAFFKSDGLYVIDSAGTVTGPLAGAGGFPVLDTTNLVKDPSDTSKQVRIDAGAISVATTRVLAMGDRDVDLAAGGTFAEASHNHAASAITSGALAAARGGLGSSGASFDGYVTMSSGTASAKKANFAASAAPTVNDDTGSNYVVGSLWIDTTNDKAYICLDASAAAAVWTELTVTGSTFLPVPDTTSIVKGSSDGSKQLRIEADGISSSTTRTLTMPDRDVDLGTVVIAAGTVAFSGDQSMGGHKLTNVATPTSGNDAVNKSYADALIAGLDVKQSVRVATTANATLSSAFENGDTVDGVTLATGDRILIKNQTTASENGIYVVAASGAPARASDMPAASSAAGAFCYVEAGTTNADKQFVCTNNAGSDVIGSNNLTFTQYGPGVTALADATDATLSSPTGGDMIYYDSLTSKWVKFTGMGANPGKFLQAGSGATAFPVWSPAVQGPGTSVTDNAIAIMDGPTGNFICQGSSGVKIDKTSSLMTTKAVTSGCTTLSDGATVTSDWSTGQFDAVTIAGNRTIAFSNAAVGQRKILTITQDGTGSRTVSWPAGVKWAAGTTPTLTTTAGRSDDFGVLCTSSGVYHGYVLGQDYNGF